MTEDLIVRCSGLSVSFGEVRAVRDLDLSIRRGWVYGLIGPNGAGKTTTLLVLATLLVPSAGECRVFGRDVVGDPFGVRPRLGYMPDFFGVYDNLKTAEYLAFFGELYGLGGAGLAGRIDEVLAMTRLEGKKDAFVETLSRGMKQRLCLAKSLVHRPELLILDEPASGLDPNARIEIRHILKDLRAAGTTVVVSSHVLSELEEVCTHVGFMEKGVLIRSGPLDEMKNAARRERHLSIRFREPARGLDSVMRLPGVLDARLAGETVRVRIADDDEVSEAVLAAAHASGARPVSIAETAPTLEDLFTTVTSGEVS